MMTILDFNRIPLRDHCVRIGLRPSILLYELIIKEHSGILNKHDSIRLSEWRMEFNNEADAIVYKLRFG